MMKIKALIPLMVLITYFAVPAIAYGSENIREVIEVIRILEKTEQEGCTRYKLEILDEQEELVEKEYCLNGGRGRHDVGTSIWVISTKWSIIENQFLIYMYPRGKHSKKVITVNTHQYPFKPSEFLELLVPTIADEGLQYRCVLSADGVIPVETFKKLFHEKMNSQLSNQRKLEKEYRKMQPWCNPD